jgi:hypothetical protein
LIEFSISTQTRRLTSDFTRNFKASKACFLPINRPLSLKKKCEKLETKYILFFLV